MTELGHSPRGEHDETTFVRQYTVNRALHYVDLHLDDLDYGLEQVQLVLGGTLQRLLVQLDCHGDHSLFQM